MGSRFVCGLFLIPLLVVPVSLVAEETASSVQEPRHTLQLLDGKQQVGEIVALRNFRLSRSSMSSKSGKRVSAASASRGNSFRLVFLPGQAADHLWTWFFAAADEPRELSVAVRDAQGNAVAYYSMSGCRPLSWEVDSGTGEVEQSFRESLGVECESVQRLGVQPRRTGQRVRR